MTIVTLCGKKKADIAHVEENGGHWEKLKGKGWIPLAELDDKAIRALAPDELKLPSNAKKTTLARAVTEALTAPKPPLAKKPSTAEQLAIAKALVKQLGG